MIDVRDIHSLSDFQRKTRDHIRRLRETGRPAVLTVNGRAELVVQDAEAYQDAVTSPGRQVSPLHDVLPLEVDPVVEAYKKGVDRSLIRENLNKTVEERLQGLVALQRLADEARRAGARRRRGAE